ncbi:MAG: hypothetical protein R3F11_14170 [Verrucomicrobiales bacterium]
MNETFQKLVERAKDAGQLAADLASSGVKFLESNLASLRLFSSLSAMSSQEADRDETHYLLVPFAAADPPFALFTKRVIPEGHGATNELPKARLFHLPDPAARQALDAILLRETAAKKRAEIASEADLASRLDSLAEQIDKQTNLVSGGLLLIGGAVAFANPLVGAAIIAKSLLPSLGAKASKLGFNYVGGKLRKWHDWRADASAQSAARDEIKRLKPEIAINPLLKSLDVILASEDPKHDPFVAEPSWVTAFERARDLAITAEAIRCIYAAELSRRAPSPDSRLHDLDLRWLRHVAEIGVDERLD